ncbi:MAG: hypothetical protein HWE34_04440 [Methylocystaceae bacterium]|nr:hypothetical protein [Methylocystaceae bacterium]
MSDFESQVQVDMTGNLAAEAKRGERAIEGLSTRSTRAFNKMRWASMGLSSSIDKLGNRYTGLVTGGGIAIAAKGVVDFDAKLKDIEVQAGLTGEQIAALKQKLFEVAQNSNIRINPSQLMGAVDAIVEKTGDLDLAQNNLESIGLAIRAVGAEGRDIGAVVAGLKKLGVTEPDQVRLALEKLIEQGKAGAFTFKDLAAEAGPLMASLSSIGQTGMAAVNTLGALAQTTQMATDSASESSTAIQALIREIAVKGKNLEKKGITVFDPQAAAKGKEEFLALDKIVRSIIEKSQGRVSRYGQLFGEEAQKALKILGSDFQKTGGLGSLDQFMSVNADGTQIIADAASKTQTMTAAIDSLNGALTRAANDNLAQPIQQIADAINSLETDELNNLFDLAVTGVTAAGGIWAVNKAIRGTAAGIRMVRSIRGSSKGIGGAAANAMSAATAQPVIVTNWPNGFGTSGGTEAVNRNRKGRTGKGRFGSRLGRLGKFAGRAGRAIPGAAVALGALSMGSAALEGDTRGVVSGGGALAGGLLGAQGGAMAGALAGPIGAAVGAALGGGIGAWLGEEATSALFSSLFGKDGEQSSPETREQIEVMKQQTKALEENTRAQAQSGSSDRIRRHPDLGGLEAG